MMGMEHGNPGLNENDIRLVAEALIEMFGNEAMWSKNLSPFLDVLARGEFQLTSFKIAMIKERPPKMNNPAVSNSFSSTGAKDFMPPPGGNT